MHRRTPARPLATALSVVLALLLGAAACTGGDESGDGSSAGASASTGDDGAQPEPTLEVDLGDVTGTLPKAVRRSALATSGNVVQTWLRAAYVGGTFPREKFGNATLGMTAGAAEQARDQSGLTSNAAVSATIESLEVEQMKATIDLLGRGGRPVGATARFTLRFTTTGEPAGTESVTGRLYLTPGTKPAEKGVERHAWRIFGYDVARSAR